MTRRWTLVGAIAPVVLTAACGGGGDGGSGGDFSVARLLDAVPAADREAIDIWAADLDAAGEAAGLERPTEPGDDFITWTLRISGIPASDSNDVPRVGAFFPSIVQQVINLDDEIVDEAGWSVSDIGRFIEVGPPPDTYTVMQGSFDEAALTDAMGAPDDDVWHLGQADEGEMDMEDRTALRRFGQALQLGLDDDRLILATTTDVVDGWLNGDGDTLADDDRLSGVAAALDDDGVYAAMVTTHVRSFVEANERMSPEQIEHLEDEFGPDGLLEPFDVVGVGLSMEDDEARMTVAYHFPDDETAEDGVTRLEGLLDGTSIVNGGPLAERFDGHEVSADGPILRATVTLGPDTPARIAWSMFQQGEVFFLHG